MTETTRVDFSERYTVAGYPGVVFRLTGYAQESHTPESELTCLTADCEHDDASCWTTFEPEMVDNPDMVIAIMVGDDREHIVDVADLTPISREDFCGECGQVGCAHDGLDRTLVDPEETRWVEVWVVNDPDYYDGAISAAQDGPEALREYVHDALTTARPDTGAWHTAREMSEGDYDRVDWQEICETLVAR